MSDALANRFAQHILVAPDVDEWCDWAVRHSIDPLILAFIRFRPGALSIPPSNKGDYAFPAPRSWAMLSRLWQAGPDRDLELAVAGGCVGPGEAVEFTAFVRLYRNLPNIDAILLDPAGSPVPDDVATIYAVSAALASRADEANFGRVLAYLDRLPAEYAVYAVRDATVRLPDLTSTPEFTNWAINHSNIL